MTDHHIATPDQRRTRRASEHFDATRNSAVSCIAQSFTDQIIRIWNNRISEYLLAHDSRRHVWHCWLASDPPTADAEVTHAMLTNLKSAKIVAAGYGSCPAGLLRALGKLGPQARSREFYLTLHRLLTHGGPVATYIQHLRVIDDRTIFDLSRIGRPHASDRMILKTLKRSPSSRLLAELSWIVGRLSALDPKNTVANVVRSNDPVTAVRRLICQQAFPPPPFSSRDTRLKPIETSDHLLEVAKSLNNCLTERERWLRASMSVQTGVSYFYHWTEEPTALLSFEKFGSLGWIITDIGGPENGTIHPQMVNRIQGVLIDIPETFYLLRHRGFQDIIS